MQHFNEVVKLIVAVNGFNMYVILIYNTFFSTLNDFITFLLLFLNLTIHNFYYPNEINGFFFYLI